jgi:PIN domain nuclease of toxin-antitoxin system
MPEKTAVVADTHTSLWYLEKNPKLSLAARSALNAATATSQPIFIPSISLVELTYLIEKGRLPAGSRALLIMVLAMPNSPLELASLDLKVAAALELIDRAKVPDMPDRIIAATALALGLPLISRDRKIQLSQVATIW